MESTNTVLYRYPGTKPFEASEYQLFKGRNEDIRKLYELISVQNLIVLFSRSGLGKSSLLNAGLVPKFKEEGKTVPLFIRFGAHYKENTVSPVDKMNEIITKECQNDPDNFLFKKLIPHHEISVQRLWYLFKSLQIANADKNTFVLIFDQFEELFTYPEQEIERFKKELSELLFVKVPQQLRDIVNEKMMDNENYLSETETELIYKPLEIKILFAIRSDKLSLIHNLTDYFPTVLKYCYELKPLNTEQAKQALILPAQLTDRKFISPPFTYSDDALKLILDTLTTTKKTELELPDSLDIETFQLQIICKYAESLVIEKGITHIQAADLGNITSIFENHYKNIINKLPAALQKPAQKLIEEKLIVDKTRVPMPILSILKEMEEDGMTKELLDDLINTHIIRPDENNTIEISHDTLIDPILKSYEERKIVEEKENEFREKEAALKRMQEEQEKRLKEQQQQQELENQKLKTRRNKLIITVVSAALCLSLLMVFYTYNQANKADIERKAAIEQQQIANAEKKAAEKQQENAEVAKEHAIESKMIADQQRMQAIRAEQKANEQRKKAEKVLYLTKLQKDSIKNLKDQIAGFQAQLNDNSAEIRKRYWLTLTKSKDLLDTVYKTYTLDSLFGLQIDSSKKLIDAMTMLSSITKNFDDSIKAKFIIVKNGDQYFITLTNINPGELMYDYLNNFLYAEGVKFMDIDKDAHQIKIFQKLRLFQDTNTSSNPNEIAYTFKVYETIE